MIDLNDKIISNYRNSNENIKKFHGFILNVFPGINFNEWHQKGFWKKNYIPHSIIKNGVIISNVCTYFCDIWINGSKKKAIQIGAVGTLPEYRNQGLSRELMNYVIKKYNNKVDNFFLFANKSVLDFYPKFGFKNILEYQFTSGIRKGKVRNSIRKIEMTRKSDYNILKKIINKRKVLTKRFGPLNYGCVTWWHILNNLHDDIYYLQDWETVIINKEKENVLHIYDVIFRDNIDFQEVLSSIQISNKVDTMKFYFPPDQINYKCDSITREDTGLFVRGNVDLEKEPFRFPETAIT